MCGSLLARSLVQWADERLAAQTASRNSAEKAAEGTFRRLRTWRPSMALSHAAMSDRVFHLSHCFLLLLI